MQSSLQWQKSSFSGGGSGEDCVELAASAGTPRIHLRESETPAAVLTAGPTALRGLLDAVKGGVGRARR
ncbi:DUF397 domain-containing protein [Streptomyces sp. NPDC087440]|uniref:DUF397 domain-containing protein n=1 Tax=Streptomyces sp. NPDC087440 TaxID=3365790 RepID=UPI003810E7EC